MTTNYELYVLTGCPYCAKVLDYLDAHDIKIPIHNITTDPAARSTLETVGGKVQCPCLFINGKPLYESDDIIDYLETHAA